MTHTEPFIQYLVTLPSLWVYLLLGLSAFVENIFPPIPGDTITAFGAFLVGIGRLHFLGVYISTTMGSLLGFLSLYGLGKLLGRAFFIERDYRFLKAKDIVKAERWFAKYGYFLIAMNRFLPGVRSAISLAGGLSGLRVLRVTLLAAVSCSIWNLLWISMGYFLGSNWEAAKARMSILVVRYNIIILILFGLVILLVLIRRKWRRKKAQDRPT